MSGKVREPPCRGFCILGCLWVPLETLWSLAAHIMCTSPPREPLAFGTVSPAEHTTPSLKPHTVPSISGQVLRVSGPATSPEPYKGSDRRHLPPTSSCTSFLKRAASTSVHRPRKVQRNLDMSTVFEEPMDIGHSGTRVSTTSPRHYAWDASEKVNEDDRVPGPSSADSSTDQRGLETLGPLSSVEVDVGTYSHNRGSPGKLENISGFLKSVLSDHDPVVISLPAQGTLRHLPSAQEDVGHSLSAQQAPELSTLEQGSIQHVEAAKLALSLENSLAEKGIRETLSSSQGALEILSSKKGRVENVSYPDRSVKPLTSLPETLRPSSFIQGPHQHPLSAQGPLGPPRTDSGIQRPLSTPEAGGNLSREPGSCKSFPLTPETLDHLQSAEGPDDLSISAHGMFDPLPSTQQTLEILVYSSGLKGPSESEHRKLGHVSYVGKDVEISPFEKPAKSSSPLTPHIPVIKEVMESSSSGLGPLASTLGAAGPSLSEADSIQLSASAPVTKVHLTSSLGPSASKYYDQMKVRVLPALHGDLESSQSDQRTLEMTKFAFISCSKNYKIFISFPGCYNSSLSDQSHLLHSVCVKEALIPALSDQETEESLLFPLEDTECPPSSACIQMQEPSLSTLGPQDSLLTKQEPLKLSISLCNSLCPFPSSHESETETVALSTLSPECLEPSQSAQGELEYF
ncbi:hypothetical protein ACRRTK_001845 [Alexandromys fortis]